MEVAFIFVLISYFTDVLDGVLARKLNQETELGKIIDPLADKVTFVVILICLTIIHRFPFWAMFIIAAREIIILSGGLYLVASGRRVIQTSILGKVTGGVFAVMVIVYIVNFHSLLSISLYAALILMVITFISYAHQFAIIIRERVED